MSNYRVKDNTEEVLSAMEKAIERGLEAIGLTAEGHAKKETPVDTGRLRNSIGHAVEDKRHILEQMWNMHPMLNLAQEVELVFICFNEPPRNTPTNTSG